jgi:hypothetical protein
MKIEWAYAYFNGPVAGFGYWITEEENTAVWFDTNNFDNVYQNGIELPIINLSKKDLKKISTKDLALLVRQKIDNTPVKVQREFILFKLTPEQVTYLNDKHSSYCESMGFEKGYTRKIVMQCIQPVRTVHPKEVISGNQVIEAELKGLTNSKSCDYTIELPIMDIYKNITDKDISNYIPTD